MSNIGWVTEAEARKALMDFKEEEPVAEEAEVEAGVARIAEEKASDGGQNNNLE